MDRIGLEIIFDDQWGREQALLDYENWYFAKSRYWDFFKNWKFPICLFLGKMGIEKTFDDHLVKEQAHPDKKYWF